MSQPIERVVLALDATGETRAAIDIAVRLAARGKLRLHAVFVEDEELLRWARSPFGREVVAGSGWVPAGGEEIELHLRAAAARAREEVLHAARPHSVECSFEIVRGALETALAAASEHDLVIAAGLARPVAGHFRIESRWSAMLDLAPGPILLTRAERGRSGGVAVLLYQRSARAARLVHTAAQLADLGGGGLTLICPTALAAGRDFAGWAREQAAPAEVQLRIEVAPDSPAALHARLAELDCRLLALDPGAVASDEAAQLIRLFACDMLVAN
jgi:hypothetical protein